MSTAFAPAECPSSAEIRTIAALGDPILRNLRITEAYHRLAVAFAVRTGTGANWCCFAIWASRQAGRTIRAEDAIEILKAQSAAGSLLLHPIQAIWRWLLRCGLLYPETRLGRIVRHIHSPFDGVERASESVARGNLKVFAEIAEVFARYLELCPPGTTLESPAYQNFLSFFLPGGAPEGQDLLKSAFALYLLQESTVDPTLRAQQILLANLRVGMHEQIRLQPEIQGSMEAGPQTAEDLGMRALQAIYPGAWNWKAFVRRPLAVMLKPIAQAFARYSRSVSRRAITSSMMTLALPETTLQLCSHIDREYPEWLRDVRDPELAQLIHELEPQDGKTDNCAAQDWSDLKERMHFILHLFRCFQYDLSLFHSPYTNEQRSFLFSGRVPSHL